MYIYIYTHIGVELKQLEGLPLAMYCDAIFRELLFHWQLTNRYWYVSIRCFCHLTYIHALPLLLGQNSRTTDQESFSLVNVEARRILRMSTTVVSCGQGSLTVSASDCCTCACSLESDAIPFQLCVSFCDVPIAI